LLRLGRNILEENENLFTFSWTKKKDNSVPTLLEQLRDIHLDIE